MNLRQLFLDLLRDDRLTCRFRLIAARASVRPALHDAHRYTRAFHRPFYDETFFAIYRHVRRIGRFEDDRRPLRIHSSNHGINKRTRQTYALFCAPDTNQVEVEESD